MEKEIVEKNQEINEIRENVNSLKKQCENLEETHVLKVQRILILQSERANTTSL